MLSWNTERVNCYNYNGWRFQLTEIVKLSLTHHLIDLVPQLVSYFHYFIVQIMIMLILNRVY